MILAALLFFTACPGEGPVENQNGGLTDADSDSDSDHDGDGDQDGPYTIDDPYELTPFQNGVDRESGVTGLESSRPGPGEVRLGRIQGEETGFTGIWSHCRPGDFLISNHEIVACIQNETTNRYETYTGGKLVDLRRHGQQGEDVFDMTMPLIDFGLATGDQVEIVRDGTDGVAVLRVTGTDIELAHLAGVTGLRLGTRRNLEVITEFRLLPDSKSIEMVTFLSGSRTFLNLNIGDWFAYGDRARAWSPGSGIGIPNRALPWVGGFGDGHSYGLVFEESATPMGVLASQGIPYAEMRIEQVDIRSNEPAVYRRWIMVGDGSIDSLRLEAAQLRGEELEGREVTIQLRDSGGAPVGGAEVLIFDDGTPLTWNKADEAGNLTAFLSPGDYSVEISRFAGPLAVDEEITVGPSGSVAVILPETAQVSLSIREEGTERPITSRVRFQHPDYGTWFEYAPLGELTTRVPAGSLDLVVTRGMEYDLFTTSLSVGPGESDSLQVALLRGLNTTGWRSGDFHQHMEPSIDSRIDVYTRILENVSQGVELVVPTDHEVVTDLRPYIEILGLGEELSSFPGVEISPIYAHFNLYPAPFDATLRGRGSISLAHRLENGDVEIRRMPEIIEIARTWHTDPIVQMNHPRNNSGMFNHVNFDPELGPDAVTNADFTYDIDTIEVINRYNHICMVLADWSGLLNYGKRVTGLGNSDSHNANGEAGVPRNFFRTDREPGDLDADLVRDALRNQRVTVASHAYINFGDEMLPGDDIQVTDGAARFHVQVQTPDWSSVDLLFVIVNGEVLRRIERTADAGARYDFDEVIDLEITEDSWVVFWADGTQPTAPVPHRKKVVAFTNPVFVATTDGPWQAPGVRPLALDSINTGYCD